MNPDGNLNLHKETVNSGSDKSEIPIMNSL